MTAYEVLPEFVQDSPEWHAARQDGIGASDVAAILGLSPWQTPLGVYRAKMGVPNEIPENLAYWGHALEEPLAQWVRGHHPEVGLISDGFSARSVQWPWLTASPDRIAYESRDGVRSPYCPVELKTSSAFGRDKWADGVPLYYEAQVQAQLAVLDAPYGWLAVLHGGNDPELYRVERDDQFITEHLVPKTREFWEQHVLAQVPPEPTTTAEAVDLWPGDPGLTIEGDERLYELWDAYGLMQAEQVELAQKLDAIKLELQKAMQDATALVYQGRELFTWKPRAGAKRLDTTALKKAHPDLVAEFTRQGEPTRTFLRKTVKEVMA